MEPPGGSKGRDAPGRKRPGQWAQACDQIDRVGTRVLFTAAEPHIPFSDSARDFGSY